MSYGVGRLNRISSFYLIIILSFITLISFSSLILASEDFLLTSKDKEINLCQCSDIVEELKIKNKGYLSHTYKISNQNKAAEFSNINPKTILLGSGKEQIIYNVIQAPCDKQGSFILDTIVSDENNYKKRLTKTVNINRCSNIKVTPINSNQTISSCGSLIYEFKIKNIGG